MDKNYIKTIRNLWRLIFFSGVFTVLFSVSALAATVEYGNMRQLIIDGNTSLNSVNESLEKIEWQIEELGRSRLDVKELRQIAEETGDEAAAQQYRMNEEQIEKTIGSLEKSYDRQAGAGGTMESTVDRLEKSAQTMLIAYNQMKLKADAAQKSYDASAASFNSTTNKYIAGVAGESDVSKASAEMLMRQNQLESAEQQLASMEYSLLSVLGITDDGTVTIGDVPEPDIAAITSIDKEADSRLYISYDTALQNARKTRNSGNRADEAAVEAGGNAAAAYENAYNQLQAELAVYQSQSQAFSAAQSTYDALLRKRQAGMLTDTALKAGEASYYEALASYKTAAMNLLQKQLNYQWSLQGV